jgi:ribosome biogenesis ATPase
VFQRATNSSPCVIFFDEIDALCPRRSDSAESSSSSRVVNQLLTEMDGLVARKQVFVIGATNRPGMYLLLLLILSTTMLFTLCKFNFTLEI